MTKEKLVEKIFYVCGLHCSACELLIEKRLIKEEAIDEVNVSMAKGTVQLMLYENQDISVEYLNKIFKKDGYSFSQKAFKNKKNEGEVCQIEVKTPKNWWSAIAIAGAIIGGYLLLSKSGFSSLILVDNGSALPMFLVFGLLAGFSSCAALVGGIILSLSKQWNEEYGKNATVLRKSEPHILFNLGRLAGYAILGGILGLIGSVIKISPVVTASTVIAISIIMILLGLQMIGVKALKGFQIRLPKEITSKIADEKNFNTKMAPLLMGALTFFLPCGFTITTQALALSSGSWINGSLIMGLFALGTVPGLLMIGVGSVKMHSNPRLSQQFSIIAGILVLFFAAFNINAQLAVLGIRNTDDLVIKKAAVKESDLPPMKNGVQVIKIEANTDGYSPKVIRMRANTPTRWEVKAISVSGCTNAIISRGLFEGQIDLVNGKTATKEFMAPKAGAYKYSCWMGMVTGTVEVVDDKGEVPASFLPVESGVKGGGCGCGGMK